MTTERKFALSLVALAVAAGLLMVVGNEWQRHLGWALWPLLIVLPVVFGRLRMRRRA
jgi:hypothetical protein